MTTKLTIDDSVIDSAKKYARDKGKSLSGITLPENTASRKLLKKLGLKLKGTIRLPNDPEDLLLYSTLL